jgi:hypothetical protein
MTRLRPLGASHIVWVGPPKVSTFMSLPSQSSPRNACPATTRERMRLRSEKVCLAWHSKAVARWFWRR